MNSITILCFTAYSLTVSSIRCEPLSVSENKIVEGRLNELKLISPVLINDGMYRLNFHPILNALFDVLYFWGCRTTAFVVEHDTGLRESDILKFFGLRSANCRPTYVVTMANNEGSDHEHCDFHNIRYIVYIGHQHIEKAFQKFVNCYGLFESMRTWIIVAPYSTVSYFEKNKLLEFTKSHMSQITLVVPESLAVFDNNIYISGNVSRLDIFDVFYSELSFKVEVIQFAYWTRQERFHYLDKIKDQKQLRGRKVRIVIVKSTCPYVCVGGANDSELQRGYLVDLFSALENPLSAKHVHHIAQDGTFGTMSPNKSFNGFIGQLQRGEQDLAMMSASIVEERKMHAIHYGAVLINGDMQMTIKRPTSMVPPTIYMLPFRLSVWFTVLGFLILIYVIMVVIHRVNLATDLQEMEISNLQRDITGRQRVNIDFFDQISDFRGLAARVVTFTQVTAALLIFTYYTSILTSVLTYRETKLPFLTLEEMVTKDEFKVLVVKATIYQHAFESAKEGVYKQVWDNIKNNRKRGLIQSFNQGFRMLSSKDKYVYLTNGFILQNVVKSSCTLMFVPAKYMKETFNLPVRKDFPYLQIYSNSFLRLRESGIYNRLEKLYITSDYMKCDDKGASQTLEITQVYALFVFQLIGCIVSLLSLLVENVVYLHKRRTGRFIYW
ncbi:hypothetical protein CHUAL_003047 [Chamberlinius hualienensis]